MSDEMIHVEEEMTEAAEGMKATAKRWTEEISVRGGDVRETVSRLVRKAGVRKITVKSANGRTIAQIPLVLGAAGVLIIGPWTAALLVAAWLTRVSILIEYEEPVVEALEEKFEEAVEAVTA
jgi:hypothetical protein